MFLTAWQFLPTRVVLVGYATHVHACTCMHVYIQCTSMLCTCTWDILLNIGYTHPTCTFLSICTCVCVHVRAVQGDVLYMYTTEFQLQCTVLVYIRAHVNKQVMYMYRKEQWRMMANHMYTYMYMYMHVPHQRLCHSRELWWQITHDLACSQPFPPCAHD